MKSLWKYTTLYLLLLGGLYGCLSPTSRKENNQTDFTTQQRGDVDIRRIEENTSFYISKEIQGYGTDASILRDWAIPLSRSYSFRICLSDRETQAKIIGQNFTIVEDLRTEKSQVHRSDDQGCITWQETIPFNYFAEKSQFIILRRKIRGHGVHHGNITFPIAINPWKNSRNDQLNEVVDPTETAIPRSISLEASRNLPTVGFQVRDLALRIDSNQYLKDGNEIEIEMSFTPRVVFENLNDQKIIYDFKQGDFSVYAQLIGVVTENDQENIFPVSGLLHADQSNQGNGRMSFSEARVDVNFKTPIHTHLSKGHYELFLRVRQENLPLITKDFTATYRYSGEGGLLRSRSNIRPRLSSIEHPEEMKAFDQALKKEITDEFLHKNAKLGLHRLPPFTISPAQTGFLEYFNETTTQRSLAYQSKVCLFRGLDGRRVYHEDFIVKLDNGIEYPVNTRQDGCISWVDTITHQYYIPERIFRKVVEIHHPLSGFTQEVSLFVNPWDFGWTFARDERDIHCEYVIQSIVPECSEVKNGNYISLLKDAYHRRFSGSSCDQYLNEKVKELKSKEDQFQRICSAPSTLFLTGFGYDTIRFRYEIDEFLNLEVKKSLLLNFEPYIFRYHSITAGRNATEAIRDGVYLLKVAIQKDYYDPRATGLTLKSVPNLPHKAYIEGPKHKEVEYISAVKKLVRIQNGRVITPVEFSVRDLRLMRIRSNFLIELAPIDEAALGIRPEIPITDLDPVTIMNRINQGRQKRGLPQVSSIDELNQIGASGPARKIFLSNPNSSEDDPNRITWDPFKEDIVLQRRNQDFLRTLDKYKIKTAFESLPQVTLEMLDNALTLHELRDIDPRRFQRFQRQTTNRINQLKIDDVDEGKKNKIRSQLHQILNLSAELIREEILPEYNQIVNHLYGDREKDNQYSEDIFDVILSNSGTNVVTLEEKDLLSHEVDCNRRRARVQNLLEANDIDCLIARESGLAPRTFVGPVILLSNKWGAAVRPTDELTEKACRSIDCDFLKEHSSYRETYGNPDEDKYYGAQTHLHNMTVTQLIERQRILEREFRNQQVFESNLERYIEDFHLDYISVRGTEILTLPEEAFEYQSTNRIYENDNKDLPYFTQMALDLCGEYDLSKCLIEKDIRSSKTTAGILISQFSLIKNPQNSNRALNQIPHIDRNYLDRFIRSRENNFDQYLPHRLCSFWIYHMLGERYGIRADDRNRRSLPFDFTRAFEDCTRDAVKNLDDVFVITKHIRPAAGSVPFRYLGGKPLNFNVGVSFSLDYGQKLQSSVNVDFNFAKLIPILSSIFSLKREGSAATSRSYGNGVSINASTYLAMQMASFDLYFSRGEYCKEIRLRTEEVINRRHTIRHILMNVIPEEYRNKASGQGVFICTGVDEKIETPYRENFYYFTQHFTEGDMLDSGDLMNHPWLLFLRGDRDYTHFISLIDASTQNLHNPNRGGVSLLWLPNEGMKHFVPGGNGQRINNIRPSLSPAEDAFDALIEAYHYVSPGLPGMYIVPPPRAIRDYPDRSNALN